MDDDNNSRTRSYIWLFILIVLGLLICIFIKTPDQDEHINVYQTNKQHDNNLEVKITLYDKLYPDIDKSINKLQQKYNEAKKIVPSFPEFPNIWLIPPKDKGKYGSIPERYCIQFLHLLFPQYEFIKKKHSWMRNPKTNYPLELDAFCPELMIGLEYNGIQHYVWPNINSGQKASSSNG